MVLILIVTLLILGIAFYQVLQGLFSAMISAILTVLCAALAWTLHEPFAREYLHKTQPAYADAIALIALFVIPLIAARFLLDFVVRGNVVMSAWVDRIAGGVVGLFIGMIQVGVLMIAMQMLPLGGWFFTYRPFDDTLQVDQRLYPFRPDEFTLGLMDMLAVGGLKADPERTYGEVHDNPRLEWFCARNRVGVRGNAEALPETLQRAALRKLDAYDPNGRALAKNVPFSRLAGDRDEQEGTTTLWVVRAEVDTSAADDDGWYRLAATHHRMVTRSGKSHYPVAYLMSPQAHNRRSSRRNDGRNAERDEKWILVPAEKDDDYALIGELMVARNRDQLENTVPPTGDKATVIVVDWVYRIPEDETPDRLVFRRVSSLDLEENEARARDEDGDAYWQEQDFKLDVKRSLDNDGKGFMQRWRRKKNR